MPLNETAMDLSGKLGPQSRKVLVEKEPFGYKLLSWGGNVFIILGIALSVYLFLALFEFDWQNNEIRFFPTVLATNPESAAEATRHFIELLSEVLGIMITVVAIVLSLAAERFGSGLIDLFLKDKVNRIYFALLLYSLLFAILLVYNTKKGFFPSLGIEILLIVTLIEIALLGPYFLFVFKFLTPDNILSTIQEANRKIIIKATEPKSVPSLKTYQNKVAMAFERVTDMALSATTNMDRNLGLMDVNQICEMLLDYLSHKHRLSHSWFQISQDSFIGISSEFYEEFCKNRLWVEAKAFMNMELVFRSCISSMPDVISAIAYNTRIIGEAAIRNQDSDLLEMAVKYYNSFIRICITAKNIRAIFNLFYQYRLLTESVFDFDIKLSEKILRHFLYYGETCMQQGLGFVLMTAAFDLGSMISTAYDKKLKNIKDLLIIFLALEDKVDRTNDMVWYTGVRNAQLILASYLLSKGDHELLQVIVEDLKSETLVQLVKWRDGLLAIEDRKFWEFTDRGYRFEYMDNNQKKYLKLFYEQYILSQPELFRPADKGVRLALLR